MHISMLKGTIKFRKSVTLKRSYRSLNFAEILYREQHTNRWVDYRHELLY